MYTENRGDGKTIVVSGFRWVYAQRFQAQQAVADDKVALLEEMSRFDSYVETIDFSGEGYNGKKSYHGPYPLESISHTDYEKIELPVALEKFAAYLKNPLFEMGAPFDQNFKDEATELFKKELEPVQLIYWLNREFDPGRDSAWSIYGFWAEFIGVKDGELIYITLSED